MSSRLLSTAQTMWDRWKAKHPWMGGRLSSILFFIVCVLGEVMINVCVVDTDAVL